VIYSLSDVSEGYIRLFVLYFFLLFSESCWHAAG